MSSESWFTEQQGGLPHSAATIAYSESYPPDRSLSWTPGGGERECSSTKVRIAPQAARLAASSQGSVSGQSCCIPLPMNTRASVPCLVAASRTRSASSRSSSLSPTSSNSAGSPERVTKTGETYGKLSVCAADVVAGPGFQVLAREPQILAEITFDRCTQRPSSPSMAKAESPRSAGRSRDSESTSRLRLNPPPAESPRPERCVLAAVSSRDSAL